MHVSIVCLLALAATAAAWLPTHHHKRIYALDGTNLFSRASTLAKRGLTKRPTYATDRMDAYRKMVRSTQLSNSSTNPIRGVNLGSLFVFEPWIAESEWSSIGCGSAQSEFDCGLALGQDGVNAAFQKHWGEFYTQDDFTQMTNLGLNTIRIPVGYWMREDIVDDSEPFPQGGFDYLKTICGWAADAGLYQIIDLHGAPGAQVSDNADTGQYASSPGFYTSYNFERALKFLEWMAQQIHTNNEFRNVGMLEIVNEPIQGGGEADYMRQAYYPAAFTRIRAAESSLGISSTNQLHIQMMNELWGSGDPNEYLNNTTGAAYDDHRYIKWAGGQTQTKAAYMATSCNDNRGGDTPTIVGEFSLSAPLDDSQQNDPDWDPSQNVNWYLGWFSAQARAYEKQEGWIFWTWKAFLNDPRWSYRDAVAAGLIYEDLDDIYGNGACDGY